MIQFIGIIIIAILILFIVSNIMILKKIKNQFTCTNCHKLNTVLNGKCEQCQSKMNKPKIAYKSLFRSYSYRDDKGNQIYKKERLIIIIDTLIYLLTAWIIYLIYLMVF